MHINYETRTLSEALSEARDKIRAQIITLHGSDAADWVMQYQANAMMDPERFDPNEGFNICHILPDIKVARVSALDELLDNVVEHSGAPRTGIAAYSEGDGVFEISISDSGMGVLKSLRRANEYAHLDDHGDALKLFIKDRVSRFGPESGRGFGFRPIFTGLANAQFTIRFRSGDHALQIDGTRLCEAPATLLQSVNMDGLVCTVVCHNRNAN